MELTPGLFSHHTFSPTLLLLLGVFAGLVGGSVAFARHRQAGILIGALSSAVLIVLAGAHIPVITLIAPRSFCFGDVGVIHAVSFVLPIVGPLVAGRSRASQLAA